MTEGEAKDKILRYSITKFEQHIQAQELRQEVFPDISEKEVEYLFEKIQRTNPDAANIGISEYNCLITSTPLTKIFLDNGGFTKIEKELKDNKAREKEREAIEFEKSKVDLELAKQMLQEYPKTKWFARIGLFIAISLAILELIKWFISLN